MYTKIKSTIVIMTKGELNNTVNYFYYYFYYFIIFIIIHDFKFLDQRGPHKLLKKNALK